MITVSPVMGFLVGIRAVIAFAALAVARLAAAFLTWASNAMLAATLSSCAMPCVGAAERFWKMRGVATMAACSGCASGTLMISMRMSAELGFLSSGSWRQPPSSVGERTADDPEM